MKTHLQRVFIHNLETTNGVKNLLLMPATPHVALHVVLLTERATGVKFSARRRPHRGGENRSETEGSGRHGLQGNILRGWQCLHLDPGGTCLRIPVREWSAPQQGCALGSKSQV